MKSFENLVGSALEKGRGQDAGLDRQDPRRDHHRVTRRSATKPLRRRHRGDAAYRELDQGRPRLRPAPSSRRACSTCRRRRKGIDHGDPSRRRRADPRHWEGTVGDRCQIRPHHRRVRQRPHGWPRRLVPQPPARPAEAAACPVPGAQGGSSRVPARKIRVQNPVAGCATCSAVPPAPRMARQMATWLPHRRLALRPARLEQQQPQRVSSARFRRPRQRFQHAVRRHRPGDRPRRLNRTVAALPAR